MKRRWIFVTAAFAVALGLVGLAEAQRAGGGFGGGAGAGGGVALPITLLTNASVKKEIEVTDEEMEKLPAAIQKALAEVLTPKQFKRLRQIELQQRGLQAFTDKTVVTELKLTNDQETAIKTVVADSAKDMKEAFGGGKGTDFKERAEKVANMRKASMEKAEDVLSAEQKKTWTVMIGDPFKLETPAFGGGNFGKKKKAAE
jgi:hypothetical protein